MDKGIALKLAIGASVFGILFMTLWILGGLLLGNLMNKGRELNAPVTGDIDTPPPETGRPRAGAHFTPPGKTEPDLTANPTSLIEQLSHDEYGKRRAAEDRLVAMGEGAIPWLEKALESDDPETRWRAAEAIRRIREGN